MILSFARRDGGLGRIVNSTLPAFHSPSLSFRRSQSNEASAEPRLGEAKVELPGYYNNNDEVRRKNAGKETISYFDDTITMGTVEKTEYFQSKRKIALWLAYIGTDYKGSQFNPTEKTIEGDVVKALHEEGFISDSNIVSPHKFGLESSSRTDKGVHSLKTVISAKLENRWLRAYAPVMKGEKALKHEWRYFINDQCKEIPDKINQRLPRAIRVIKAIPVNPTFSAREEITRRQYDYYLPYELVQGTLYETDRERSLDLFKFFEGRHNWHNFVGAIRSIGPRKRDLENMEESARRVKDARALRNFSRAEQVEKWVPARMLYRRVIEVAIDEVTIKGDQSRRFVRLKFDGESFVLNQIRKMVTFWLMLIKGVFPADLAHLAIHGPFKFNIPPAPPNGLLLRGVIATQDGSLFGKAFDLFDPDEADQRRIHDFEENVLIPEVASDLEANSENYRLFAESLKDFALEEEDLKEIKAAIPLYEQMKTNVHEKVLERKASFEGKVDTKPKLIRTKPRDPRAPLVLPVNEKAKELSDHELSNKSTRSEFKELLEHVEALTTAAPMDHDLDKVIISATIGQKDAALVAVHLKRLQEERSTFVNRFVDPKSDRPRFFGAALPQPLQFSPFDFIPLSDSFALFGTGLATTEATLHFLLSSGALSSSRSKLTRVALVRDLFDRSPLRPSLSAIVRFVKSEHTSRSGPHTNFSLINDAVLGEEGERKPRWVCEYVRNPHGEFVQVSNNVPLPTYLRSLGLELVPVPAKICDESKCIPVLNYFNEALITPNEALAEAVASKLPTTVIKIFTERTESLLSDPFLAVGMNTNFLDLTEAVKFTSDSPLLYDLRTSVVESKKDKAFIAQTTNTILMIVPVGFQRNTETALDNYFMQASNSKEDEIERLALAEFAALHRAFVSKGINVIVKSAENFHQTPDAVFPNNWFSTHPSNEVGASTVVVYPMKAPSRRAERRQEIASELQRVYSREMNFCLWENSSVPQYLEGTGVLIYDRPRRIAYVSLSERASEAVAREWAQRTDYSLCLFRAFDSQGKSIYHTNVMMSVGSSLAVVCFESIPHAEERAELRRRLTLTHTVIEISLSQVNEMCGNVLEVRGENNRRLLCMSSRAFNGFTAAQKETMLKHVDEVVHAPIPTIENIGGGSVRCMMAEIF